MCGLRGKSQFVNKLSSRLLVDLNFGSLHEFERTKVGIYYEIDGIFTAKKCKIVSLFLNIML